MIDMRRQTLSFNIGWKQKKNRDHHILNATLWIDMKYGSIYMNVICPFESGNGMENDILTCVKMAENVNNFFVSLFLNSNEGGFIRKITNKLNAALYFATSIVL